eukprot:NODE_5655_length_1746_cov_13.114886.p1 GENE.NODE_5655_length_1746_cov_13.114886~~NODE_5655_length_1746_cov_13.114886.p1  ORF type:complete len:523 (-),score=170.95 NODE_5655_length_1746_cov_13.114886:78-1646(-)
MDCRISGMIMRTMARSAARGAHARLAAAPALRGPSTHASAGTRLNRCFPQVRGFGTVKVPEFGAESITEGTLSEWDVDVGATVSEGDLLAIIETDKVSIEVVAEEAGTLSKIIAQVDVTVEVGQALAEITAGAAPVAKEAAAAAAAAPAPAATPEPKAARAAEPAAATAEPVDVRTPEFGAESITEGTLMEWEFAVGDHVGADDVLTVIETDKVSIEVKAGVDGVVEKLVAEEETTVEVGQLLAVVVPGAKAAAAPEQAAPKPAPAAPKPAAPKPAPAAPSAAVRGSRVERREKMPRMRQSIASHLKSAQNTTASLTTFQEVDMSGIINMRKAYKDIFAETHGVKLGFMSPFVKASAIALQRIPGINAYIDDAKKEIVYRDYVDVSVAVATPKGLVVPVLRNCEKMSLQEIEKSIVEVATKARKGTLSFQEMSGGTFTISNGGVFGSMLGTPIINMPQSGILGMHATKMRPVVLKSGEIAPRPMMYLALTYDHRLVDGREAATFLVTVRDLVEDPVRMFLDV